MSYSLSNGFLYATGGIVGVYVIYKINPGDGSYSTIYTENGGDTSKNNLPTNLNLIACTTDDDSYIYCVVDAYRVYKFQPNGTMFPNIWAVTSYAPADINTITYNPYNKTLYLLYAHYTVIVSINLAGTATTVSLDGTDSGNATYLKFFDTYSMNALGINYAYSHYMIYSINAKLNYTFSSSLITSSDYSAQLYNGATPVGIPITLNIACFLQGTRILRFRAGKEEYVPVESLRTGDLIKTSKSGYKSITTIGRREFYNSPKSDIKNRLYRYRTAVCPELSEDLVVTGEHCALVNVVSDEKLREVAEYMGDIYVSEGDYRVPAHLDDRAVPYEKEGTMTVWHFSLEHENKHENYGVFANGLLVESSSEQYLTELSGMKMIE